MTRITNSDHPKGRAVGLPLAAEVRARVCRLCLDCQGIHMVSHAGREVYTVSCRACGCGALNLFSGTCPAGKWIAKI